MPIDFTQPRCVAASYLLGDTFHVLRTELLDDGAGGTYADPGGPTRIGPFLGAFRALSGRELIAAEQLGQLGAYRLKTTVALIDPDDDESTVTICDTDQVEVLSGVYNVVWTPPVANLSLFRVVGLEEAHL